MRTWSSSVLLAAAVLLPAAGSAQIDQFRSSAPQVTASNASWQINSEPIVLHGLVFFPTREYRLFDGQVMAQIGIYQGVPVYADTTLEPWSLVYVPVGRDRMRVWKPSRGELAPSTSTAWAPLPIEPRAIEEKPVGTAGTIPLPASGTVSPPRTPDRRPPSRMSVWLEFEGSRWYSAGAAASFEPDRFRPIGAYHGFPVYREINGPTNRIWISVVADGPVAPYERR